MRTGDSVRKKKDSSLNIISYEGNWNESNASDDTRHSNTEMALIPAREEDFEKDATSLMNAP